MPNHTSTKLVVKGRVAEIKRLQEAVKGKGRGSKEGEDTAFSCNSVIPMPVELQGTSSPVRVVKEKDYKKAVEEAKERSKDLPFSIGLPITKKMQDELLRKYGADNWYDWSCKNWGSKWDVYDVGEWESSKGQASLFWMSAWSPVCPVIEELSRRFPELTFTIKFADEGAGFLGYETYKNGVKTEEVEVEWDNDDGVALREELGCYYPEDEQEEEDED